MSGGFDEFDDNFNPGATGFPMSIDDLVDGNYEFLIEKTEIKITPNTKEKVVALKMRVHKGPAHVGMKVEKPWFFKDQAAADRFGGDLVNLGLPAHTWTAANGKKFSVELRANLPSLEGKIVKAKKEQTPATTPGKFWHNLRFQGTVTAPPGVSAPPVTSMPPESELPF